MTERKEKGSATSRLKETPKAASSAKKTTLYNLNAQTPIEIVGEATH